MTRNELSGQGDGMATNSPVGGHPAELVAIPLATPRLEEAGQWDGHQPGGMATHSRVGGHATGQLPLIDGGEANPTGLIS